MVFPLEEQLCHITKTLSLDPRSLESAGYSDDLTGEPSFPLEGLP